MGRTSPVSLRQSHRWRGRARFPGSWCASSRRTTRRILQALQIEHEARGRLGLRAGDRAVWGPQLSAVAWPKACKQCQTVQHPHTACRNVLA